MRGHRQLPGDPKAFVALDPAAFRLTLHSLDGHLPLRIFSAPFLSRDS